MTDKDKNVIDVEDLDDDEGESEQEDTPVSKKANGDKPAKKKIVRRKRKDYGVIYRGNARRYSFRGVLFPRNEAVGVSKEVHDHLLATGQFESARANEIPEKGSQPINRDKKWRVGKFNTKDEACEYAKTVFGLVLDPKQSLASLNQMTATLAQASKAPKGGQMEDPDAVSV